MTVREKYQIAFQKVAVPNGDSVSIADTNIITSAEIASHLQSSSDIETRDQINDINDAISRYNDGLFFDEFWGEVAGSQLWIYPANNTVEVGDSPIVVPIPDFLQLLQEWLTFIGQ